MAYIGRQPTVGNFRICDAISVVNGQAAYTMQVGGVNVIPESANNMIVSLNGVIQKPGSSFTVSSSTITFSSNLSTGDVIDFIQILGGVANIGTPSDGTVTSAKINYPLTTFSSTGIDDNADQTVLTLGSNESASFAGTIASAGDLTITSTGPKVGFIESDQSNKQYQIGSFGAAYAIYDASNTQYRYTLTTDGNHIFNEGGLDCDFRVESANQSHMLFVDAGNDRLGILDSSPAYTLESGNSDTGKGWSLAAENNVYKIRTRSTLSDLQTHIQFENTNGVVGSIKTTGTSTQFNTSSDYRLKENVDYDWDATTRLKQLKPARFNWISDDTNTLLDGFIAHEVSSVVPESISGNKDATETLTNVVKNADGSLHRCNFSEAEWTKGKAEGTFAADSTWAATYVRPDYQSIDQSKLVPLLVKTIQELEARITALES